MSSSINTLLAEAGGLVNMINYEIISGNPLWRFGMVLVTVILTMALARIVQYTITGFVSRREQKTGKTLAILVLASLSRPIYVAIFALGLNFCKVFLRFDEETGIRPIILDGWTKVAGVVGAIAMAYALYRLVDVVEYYLNKIVSKTDTRLDDMLVPVIRKSLRITIAIVATLLIAEKILGEDIKSLLVSAGVGGIAIALAAKETIANFFGSVTIFTDRPFQIDELVKVEGHYGTVEDVGFRSTRIRTIEGNLVTVPNSIIANTAVENVGRRPFIRRTSNITITYDSGSAKVQRAVEIIKEVLAGIPQVNSTLPPRVYFSDFNDWSLNIYMSYWVTPPDYWFYHETNERINLEIMKRFEQEKIEFAFPSQTIYLKRDKENT